MKLNEDITLYGISSELLIALAVAATVYDNKGLALVFTLLKSRGCGQDFSPYLGNEADLCSRYLDKETQRKVKTELSSRLGADYGVVLERGHIHLKYQPKLRG